MNGVGLSPLAKARKAALNGWSAHFSELWTSPTNIGSGDMGVSVLQEPHELRRLLMNIELG